MKKIVLLLLLTITTVAFSQKKEKIKGSKIVTTEIKKVESFTALEVSDNLEIVLIKGTENAIEIEADDNVHDAIEIAITGSILRLSTTKDITSFKKLSIRVTYNDDFKMVTTHNESTVTALSDIELNDITFKSYDYSKLFLNVKCKNFTLQSDDKTKVELKVKSENATISLLKNSNLKALISSINLVFDMYQKTTAVVEGETDVMKLRLDNNADFTGKNLAIKDIDLTTESYASAILNVKGTATIQASGKSEIQLYGEQKIDVKKFTDSAVLTKKPTK
jgi:Putative auto-transporter adhesin, head GIN domain